jgi:hypothetical protein
VGPGYGPAPRRAPAPRGTCSRSRDSTPSTRYSPAAPARASTANCKPTNAPTCVWSAWVSSTRISVLRLSLSPPEARWRADRAHRSQSRLSPTRRARRLGGRLTRVLRRRRSGGPGTAGGRRRCRGPAPDPARGVPLGHAAAGLLQQHARVGGHLKGKYPMFSAESVIGPDRRLSGQRGDLRPGAMSRPVTRTFSYPEDSSGTAPDGRGGEKTAPAKAQAAAGNAATCN